MSNQVDWGKITRVIFIAKDEYVAPSVHKFLGTLHPNYDDLGNYTFSFPRNKKDSDFLRKEILEYYLPKQSVILIVAPEDLPVQVAILAVSLTLEKGTVKFITPIEVTVTELSCQ